jgi:hypothetical protein
MENKERPEKVLFDGKNKMMIFRSKEFPTPGDLTKRLVRTNSPGIKVFISDFFFVGLTDPSHWMLKKFIKLLLFCERTTLFLKDLSPITITRTEEE